MKPTAALLLAATAPLASAGTITNTVDFSHGFDGEIVTFQKFDTLGGTRELTGLSLSYRESITIDYHVESNGYTPLAAGDWFLQIGYNSLHQFGVGDTKPPAPFIGPGAAFQGDISADLGASDGYNGTGLDTYYATIDTGEFTFDADYSQDAGFGQRMLDTFTGPGELDTFFSGFSELFGGFINDPGWVVDPNNPPEGPFGFFEDPYYGFFVTFDDLLHSGQITYTYEYAEVPAPASATLLTIAGLAATRRRR